LFYSILLPAGSGEKIRQSQDHPVVTGLEFHQLVDTFDGPVQVALGEVLLCLLQQLSLIRHNS
jgi:hypothetical protein